MKKHITPRARSLSPRYIPQALLTGFTLVLSSTIYAIDPPTPGPVFVDETDSSIGVDGDVSGEASTDFTLSSTGGEATIDSTSHPEGIDGFAQSDASAESIGINGVVSGNGPTEPGDLTASFDLTAQGGTASTTEGTQAEAFAEAEILGAEAVGGEFSGSITGTATGGEATAENALASSNFAAASAEANGIGSYKGDATGSIEVSAQGGKATAGNDANFFGPGPRPVIVDDTIESEILGVDFATAVASAEAFALGDPFLKKRPADTIEGGEPGEPTLITGAYSASAAGGEASSGAVLDAYADASAGASGIFLPGSPYGYTVDAEVSAQANGGQAVASAEEFGARADASAEASGIENSGSFQGGGLGGSIDANAVGGVAAAYSDFGMNFADASAYAGGYTAFGLFDEDDEIESLVLFPTILSQFSGNLTADIEATAEGGTAINVSALGLQETDTIESEGKFSPFVGADASAYAAAVDAHSVIFGDVSGSLTASATGGDAITVQFEGFGNVMTLESEILLDGGSIIADASAEATGLGTPLMDDYYMGPIPYDMEGLEMNTGGLEVFGVVSSAISVEAFGGGASTASESDFAVGYGEAYASATATGIEGSVYGEGATADDNIESDISESFDALTGSFDILAVGGEARAFSSFFYLIESSQQGPTFPEIEGNGYIIESYYLAEASGESFAVDGDVIGDVSADFDVSAEGGLAYVVRDYFPDAFSEAIAFADASGIFGSLEGSFTGNMIVEAVGGRAVIETLGGMRFPQNTPIESEGTFIGFGDFLDASAIASGIGDGQRAVEFGEVSGDISVSATGGTAALIQDIGLIVPIDAAGIEGGVIDVSGGPGLLLPERAYNAYAQAIAIDGSALISELSGSISAEAVGGNVVLSESEMDRSSIEGAFYGGSETNFIYPGASADALAAGVAGQNISIDDISGGIHAVATPGTIGEVFSLRPLDGIESDVVENEDPFTIPEFDDPLISLPLNRIAANGFAFGLIAYTPLGEEIEDAIESIEIGDPFSSSLDVEISSTVSAVVLQPDLPDLGEEDSIESEEMEPMNAYAAAVYGGTGEDLVLLADGANIVGDINLNGGLNELYVVGDTFMQGDIMSTSVGWVDDRLGIESSAGTVDFDIQEGFFRPGGTVNVSDLTNSIEIATGSGLSPLISRMEGASLLNVSGGPADVNFAEGSIVRPVFNGLEKWSVFKDLDSKKPEPGRFLIVSTTGLIDSAGAIADGSLSPFEITLVEEGTALGDGIEATAASGENLFIVLGDVKTPGGEETPGVSQTTQAVNQSSQAVMIDISKRAALMRSLLRGYVAAPGEMPVGAAGPDAERMQKGEWLSYLSAFGNIGKQESENGAVGFDYDTYGFVIGQEKLIGDQLIVGLSGAYSQTDVDGLDGSGGGETDLYSGIVYANWFTDTWFTEGGLTYGHAQTDTRRKDIANVTYTGDYDSNLFGSWLEVGYTTTYEGLEAEPYARVSYVYGDHEGFTDSGAGPNTLTTNDTETDNFKTELGLRMTEEWVFENESKFLLGFKAAWSHEWADRSVRVDAQYLGSQLTIESPEADRAALILGISGEWRHTNGLSLGVKYEPTFAGNWYNHAFSGTLQYSW